MTTERAELELDLFADVRSALRADETLLSGRGVALNDFANNQTAPTLLKSDGEIHRAWRGAVMKPMLPSALAEARAEIDRLAESMLEIFAYARGVQRSRLRPNGWAARLFDAADRGEIAAADVAGLLIAYIAPSLDTTILGAGSLL